MLVSVCGVGVLMMGQAMRSHQQLLNALLSSLAIFMDRKGVRAQGRGGVCNLTCWGSGAGGVVIKHTVTL